MQNAVELRTSFIIHHPKLSLLGGFRRNVCPEKVLRIRGQSPSRGGLCRGRRALRHGGGHGGGHAAVPRHRQGGQGGVFWGRSGSSPSQKVALEVANGPRTALFGMNFHSIFCMLQHVVAFFCYLQLPGFHSSHIRHVDAGRTAIDLGRRY